MDTGFDAIAPLAVAPAVAYRELVYRPMGTLARWIGDRFDLVARPGQRMVEPTLPGDVLIRVTLGYPRGECDVLTDAAPTRWYAGGEEHPGWYGIVTDGAVTSITRRRRILDSTRCMPLGQLLLRPKPSPPQHIPDRSDTGTAPRAASHESGHGDPSARQSAVRDGDTTAAAGAALTPTPTLTTENPPAAALSIDVDDASSASATACVPTAEPGVPGGSPHPVIRKGSRRPSVGYAQNCLNEFLDRYQAGSEKCPADSPAVRDFISRALAAMRADGQLPLSVDCQFGINTDRAVHILQACFALDRDGAVGQDTWPVLKRFDPRASAAVGKTFRLLLDVRRDGTLTPVRTGWQWGPAGQGAVVLVNNDDDDASGRPDNDNPVIGTGNDGSDLAPLVIERTRPSLPGTTLELEVSDQTRIRIFGGTAPGSAEIIGPGTGARHQFATTSSSRIELRMEGLRYPRRGFTGEVTLTMRTKSPGVAVDVQTATVRIAPWMIPSHLDAAERVFVVDAGSDNNRFRTDLRRLVAAAGCHLVEVPQPHDIWMQDCMEFGFSSVPGKALRTVFRAPRPRPLQTFPRTLLGPDLGYTEDGTMSIATTFDSTGNLEVSPPVIVAGKRYPMGRIYYGSGLPSEEFDELVRDFLHGQLVQHPIALDTNWLTVGHVDEAITFVPAPGEKGFRLLLASPRRAYAILDRLAPTNGGAKMLTGRSLRTRYPTAGRLAVEQSVTEFLALKDDFSPELRALVGQGMVSHTSTSLRRYNERRQADVDQIRTRLTTELGLTASDIIDIPSVFMPNPVMPSTADALVPGMVNMLVLNGHCIVPKPFGPIVGGDDQFEKDVHDQLTPLGLTVSFLDCWEEYHVRHGEVHCATNTLRRASEVNWWEFTP